MDHFHYRDGELFAEDVPLARVAAEVGTPTYVYSAATLRMHLHKIQKAFAPLRARVCFAVKCCSNLAVLRTLVREGAGLDVVSGGEIHRARLAGADPSSVVFAGVGKTDAEIREALAWSRDAAAGAADGSEPVHGVIFNIESEPEYMAIAAIARAMGIRARAALRVNPGVKAGGHDYISTGTEANKFGVSPAHARAMLARFGNDPHLRLSGVHVHIGSSILDTAPYVETVRRTLEIIDQAKADGVVIDTLDLGGGFGADYQTGDAPAAAEYARVITPLLQERADKGLRIILEPGRAIAANAGVLLTRVLFVKVEGTKKFVVCDAGMHTLIRPSLYDAFHFIWPASVSPQHEPVRRAERPDLPGLEVCDVVGPVCESGDFLAKDRALPAVARGDLLTVYSAGAYGAAMSSRYNSHPLPAEVMVDGANFEVIRRRETYDDLVAMER